MDYQASLETMASIKSNLMSRKDRIAKQSLELLDAQYSPRTGRYHSVTTGRFVSDRKRERLLDIFAICALYSQGDQFSYQH